MDPLNQIIGKIERDAYRIRKPEKISRPKSILPLYKFVKTISPVSSDKQTFSPIHELWCEDLERQFRRKLLLKPRGTFKSTIYTIAYPIWRLLKDPDTRILIASATLPQTRRFLNSIQKTILVNEYLQSVGLGRGDLWAADSMTINWRRSTRKEPSIMGVGALGSIVGSHFDLIITDDLVDDKDRDSFVIRERKARWFSDLSSLLDPDGQLLAVGTRWHMDDVYGQLMRRVEDEGDLSIWDIAVEGAYTEDGELLFPDLLSEDVLAEKKRELGTIHFSAQYLNKPLAADTQVFPPEIIHYYKADEIEPIRDKLRYYAYLDPSLGESKRADYQAIIVIGVDMDKDVIYVVDARVRRCRVSELTQLVVDVLSTYPKLRTMHYESNGFQRLLRDEFRNALEDAGFDLVNSAFRGKDNHDKKSIRIQSIQGLVEAGKIRFPHAHEQTQDMKMLMQQLIDYPAANYDDAPDALVGAVQEARKGQAFNRLVF